MTTEPVGRRAPAGRPAEIAKIASAGAAGVVTFGVVVYLGLAAEAAEPEQVPTTVAGQRPAPAQPTVTMPAPAPTAVPLTTVLPTLPPATLAPVPPPPTATIPLTAPAPPPAPAVDVVTEQSE